MEVFNLIFFTKHTKVSVFFRGSRWNNVGSNFYKNRANNAYRGKNYNSFRSGKGRKNYGYHGSGVFSKHYRSEGGFFGGGKKSFALGVGAGFIGGAMAGVAAMSLYHNYIMFQNMMMYGGFPGYGSMYGRIGYGGYAYGQRGHLNADKLQCMGGK